MELTVTTQSDNAGNWTIVLDGALDLLSRNELVDAANKAFQSANVTTMTLDLAAVTFIDSIGVGSIVRIANDTDDVGARFALRQPSARVSRILQIAGLQDAWPIETVTSE